ncbi:serine hydrolase [Ponticaulis sp.]|uniref:serine hydrolase domain-containing protein n=1 Tax=Ponticaulis sp. TaxID=2020902 RepID=UPI002633B5F1|nr:serine hydrolase [Ponticaulis sp.]MDF1679047.1 serine hydrolase [Ponticaulis sp.]
MKLQSLSLLLLTGLAVACSPASQPVPEPTPATEAVSEAPVFTNADALETYQSLGLVVGNPMPLPETGDVGFDNPEAVFADALAYGAETESYALLVWWQGSLVLEHYYPGYSADVRSEPASMHKSVLGLVTAKAIEDGFIGSVDDPISLYIPEWQDDERGEITVLQLLNMSSGLASLSYVGGDDSEARQFMAGNLDARATVLGLQREEGVDGPHFHYANAVSQLLMMVVENAIGGSYANYLSSEIWQPIGAEDAYVYYFEEDGFPRGYASFLARPLDWLRLGLLVKDNGAFAGEQVISSELMEALKGPAATEENYGWQIWRGATWQEQRFYNDEKAGFAVTQSEPYLADDLVYFDGFGGQRVITSEERDLVIVRLGNTSVVWDDAQLPNRVMRALDSLEAGE